MKKKILFVQNLLLLSAALSLVLFTTSCDRNEDDPVTVNPSVDGTGTGNDGGGTGGGEFVEETLAFTVNGVTFMMKPVRGGTFWMGAQRINSSGQNYDADAKSNEQPVHQVTLSDYYMGETEVTQELWQAVMGSNPSDFTGDLQRPVERVSWYDIVIDFLPVLNAATGRTFALPTEAQWEFAARGGNQSHGYKYAGSDNIGDVAWYGWENDYDTPGNGQDQTHSVKGKLPNELGLYDMSGNVFEWCNDWFGYYGSGSQTNPVGPESSSGCVIRGGGWYDCVWNCRVSGRTYDNPDSRDYGFRLVLLP